MWNIAKNAFVVFQVLNRHVVFGEFIYQIYLRFYLNKAAIKHKVVLGALQFLIISFINLILFVVGLDVGLYKIYALEME